MLIRQPIASEAPPTFELSSVRAYSKTAHSESIETAWESLKITATDQFNVGIRKRYSISSGGGFHMDFWIVLNEYEVGGIFLEKKC